MMRALQCKAIGRSAIGRFNHCQLLSPSSKCDLSQVTCRGLATSFSDKDNDTTTNSNPPQNQNQKQQEQHIHKDDHIGRQLSKPPRLDPTVLKNYKKKVATFKKDWYTQQRQDQERFALIDQHVLGPTSYEQNALEEIHQRSYEANVLVEIRDARLPATSHHPSFTRLAKHRTHLICYTHADLLDQRTKDKIEQWTKKSFPQAECRFVDANERRQISDAQEAFVPLLHWIVDTIDRKGGNNCALTVGVPNTGKSSVLHKLLKTAQHLGWISKQTKTVIPTSGRKKKGKKKKRHLQKGKVPAIQDTPGKTRELTEYLLRDSPRLFFLDVPGISHPSFYFQERPDAWMAMGAANLLLKSKVQEKDAEIHRAFCQHVLECANRDHVFDYVAKLRLDGVTDDIDNVLEHVSRKYQDKLPPEKLLHKRCQTFLKLYNTGNLGPIVLDDLTRRYERFVFRDDHFNYRNKHNHHHGGDGGYDNDRYDGDDYDDFDDDDRDERWFRDGPRRGRHSTSSRRNRFEEDDDDDGFHDYGYDDSDNDEDYHDDNGLRKRRKSSRR